MKVDVNRNCSAGRLGISLGSTVVPVNSADVVTGSATADKRQGLGGNDAFAGLVGNGHIANNDSQFRSAA